MNYFFRVLAVTLISLSGFAAEIYNPIQGLDLHETAENIISADGVIWSQQLKDDFALLRVKVFPHNSKYNSPHSKDSTIDRLLVSSKGQCKVFQADKPTSEGGITRNQLIASGNKFPLTVAELKQAIWIECDAPIEITRPDFTGSPISYNGVLFVKPVAGTYLTAVNVLPFEEYLKGVVPSEMPAGWSIEALRAQAIAARTYAYYELGFNVAASDQNIIYEASGAQIDDTVTYQAYMGLKNAAASTNKAIEDTSGMVMTYNQKVVKAYFHADSGGFTENAENVWGVFHPYIIGKKEVYPAGSIPGESWSFITSISDVELKLRNAGMIASDEILSDFSVDESDLYPSTRPKRVYLKVNDKVVKEVSAVDFSFAMKIKSAWIRTAPVAGQKGKYQISGRGFGHGAGMNQWGAKVMVDKLKMSYQDVLKFYYTEVTIQK